MLVVEYEWNYSIKDSIKNMPENDHVYFDIKEKLSNQEI